MDLIMMRQIVMNDQSSEDTQNTDDNSDETLDE